MSVSAPGSMSAASVVVIIGKLSEADVRGCSNPPSGERSSISSDDIVCGKTNG